MLRNILAPKCLQDKRWLRMWVNLTRRLRTSEVNLKAQKLSRTWATNHQTSISEMMTLLKIWAFLALQVLISKFLELLLTAALSNRNFLLMVSSKIERHHLALGVRQASTLMAPSKRRTAFFAGRASMTKILYKSKFFQKLTLGISKMQLWGETQPLRRRIREGNQQIRQYTILKTPIISNVGSLTVR